MESTTPRAAWGCRRRVPSNRRIRTSSAASRKRMRTRLRPASRASTAGSTSSRSPPPRPTTKATRSNSDPAPSTSSETFEIRAEGMLSMTNQPRSSSVAPAVDRPAPDMPVTTRYSLIDPPLPAVRGVHLGLRGVCSRSYTAAPTSAGNQDRPKSSSFDTARRAARPPNCSIRRSRRFGPSPPDPVQRARRSSACRAGCGGTRWRTGGPRPGAAGAGRAPPTGGPGGRARIVPAGRPPRSSWPVRRWGSAR